MAESDFQLDRNAPIIGRPIGEASQQCDVIRPFTSRQLDVLRELAKGQTNKQIGKVLKLAPETVHHHLKAIFLKLGVDTREGAVAGARRRAVIS